MRDGNQRQVNRCIRSLLLSVVATAAATNAIGVMLTYIVEYYHLAADQEGLMSSFISTGAFLALIGGILLRGRIYKAWFIIGGGFLLLLVLLLSMILGAMAQNGVVVWVVRYVPSCLKNPGLSPLCLSVFWVTTAVSRVAVPRLRIQPLKFLAYGSVLAGMIWVLGVFSEKGILMLPVRS